MKKLLTTLLAAFTAAAGIQAQVAFGHAEKINKGWRFLRVDSAWNISERPEMRERDNGDGWICPTTGAWSCPCRPTKVRVRAI